jgi:hypothetical protein
MKSDSFSRLHTQLEIKQLFTVTRHYSLRGPPSPLFLSSSRPREGEEKDERGGEG